MVCKLGYVKQVGRNARHQCAHLGVVVIREGKLLQVREQVAAHIGLDLGSHNMTDRGHKIVGGSIDDAQQNIRTANAKNECWSEFGKILGGCRIGNGAHHHGEHQLANGGECGAKEVKCHNAAIGLVVGQKLTNEPYASIFLTSHSEASSSS